MKTAKKAALGTTFNIVGGWCGTEVGAAIGTAICPGVGTLVGGILGSLIVGKAAQYVMDEQIIEKNLI
jgi:outer membrane lipoprotein SlyB